MVVRREGDELPHLLPLRHRQLPSGHRAHLHRPVASSPADPALGRDAARLFNYITGYARPERARDARDLRRISLRRALLAADRRRDRPCRGRPAGADLGQAELAGRRRDDRRSSTRRAQAGVKIDLVVRGICCLRPGVAGPVGQHPGQVDRRPLPRAQPHRLLRQRQRPAVARRRGSTSRSADWMPRNFDRRVETLVPIENPTVPPQICSTRSWSRT